VSGTGFVIALEPETVNYQRLIRALAKHRQTALVKPYQAVAAARSGILRLAVNPHHPGDHKIGDSGVEVSAHALDDLLAHFNWPAVSLIKIDVQGAEAQVLGGAQQIIRRFRPAIFIEIGDEELRKFHTSAEALLSMLHSQGYEIHRLQREGVSSPLSVASAATLCRDGKYADFLLLDSPCTSNATTGNGRNLSASPTEPERK
jgi:FkbM family methyltransferase